MKAIYLKTGREKSVLRRHPWIFSGSISSADIGIAPGETVDVIDAQGVPQARGTFSPESSIRVRIWSWDPTKIIDAGFLKSRLEQALSYRNRFVDVETNNAYRIVFGEADGLPGFVVDRYADFLVIQCSTWGAERWRETLVDVLVELTGVENVYERSDVDARKLEGLQPRSGIVRGVVPPEQIKVWEGDLFFGVDVRKGQKTGFYLDQHTNRAEVRRLAYQRNVLDCFTYTGGFAISALAGGAKSIVAVDSSRDNLAQAKRNLALNSLPSESVAWIEGDVFEGLRSFRDRGKKFDLIVLDPPKFAPTSAHIHKATRGYKDINLLGFKLLRPGGLLCTFSCSGGVNQELFQKIVAWAALDAGVDARIVKWLSQPRDHPVTLNFPEGAYLKGLILQLKKK